MKRWFLPCLLAVAGSIWLTWAFPRFHPSSRLGLQLDREGYIAEARVLASRHGVDASGWRGQTKADTQTNHQMAREKLPTDEIVRTFPPGVVHATLVPNDDGAAAEVTMRPDGRALGWALPTPKNAVPREPRAIAESALRELTGDDAAKYKPTNGGTPEQGGWLFSWERTAPTPDPSSVRLEVHVEKGKVKKTETNFTLPEELGNRLDRFPFMGVIAGFVWFILLITALVLPLVRDGAANVARAMRDRAAIWLSVVVSVIFLFSAWIDWESEAGGSRVSRAVTNALGLTLGAIVLGLLYYAVLAATVLNARLHPARVRGLRLLPTKGFFSRLVGVEMLGGLLCAPALVSIPLAVSAILRVSARRGYNDDLLLSPLPALDTLAGLGNQETLTNLAFLGILIPAALRIPSPRWLSKWLRPGWLRWGAVGIAALATFAMLLDPFRQEIAANIPAVALSAALMVWLYAQFGVLGAITAACAARVIVAAGALLVQPAAGLHLSGAAILAVFGCGVVYALVAAWKGPEITTQLSGETGLTAEPRTRREELLAEFNVARSAQQQMLPARAPVLAGFTIAATCEPAREVGGDLYDFLHLQDGRVGIGVADVSGKGVPAALYMTLTKGLLCAASQDSSDPHEILTSVNTHLREAVRKKMFVTMALGVLDLEARTLEHVRAGHNPIVWRRTAAGETRMLATPGMALGMTGPALFSRTLASETIVLESGDALVFYSDGLTEAMNGALEQFGDDRLMAAVARADGLPADATRDSILNEVKDFLHGGQSQDDLTLAVVRVSDGR